MVKNTWCFIIQYFSQPSYKIPLDAYFENIAWTVCRGGFTTQSYIQDSNFCKTRERLKFNYLRKNLHTRRLTGFLMRPIVIIPALILHHIIHTKRTLVYLTYPSFQDVNRLFVLSFENDAHRRTYERYFLPTVEVKDYNIMIHEKTFLISH